MNRNLMIVLAGGFVIAILVAVIVQSGLKTEPKSGSAPTVEILVASRNISLGSNLDVSDMKWQSWPESAVFAGAVVRQDQQSTIDALSGRVRRDISSGEPLSQAAMLSSNAGNIVAFRLSLVSALLLLKSLQNLWLVDLLIQEITWMLF